MILYLRIDTSYCVINLLLRYQSVEKGMAVCASCPEGLQIAGERFQLSVTVELRLSKLICMSTLLELHLHLDQMGRFPALYLLSGRERKLLSQLPIWFCSSHLNLLYLFLRIHQLQSCKLD